MTLQLPTLLALVGAALLAIAMFAPKRATLAAATALGPAPLGAPLGPSPNAAFGPSPTTAFDPSSNAVFGPSPAAVAADRPYRPSTDADCDPIPPPRSPVVSAPVRAASVAAPSWPQLIDPCAAGCDAAARLDLIAALADVHGRWADSILQSASGDESDPAVRAALERALEARNAVRYVFGTE